MAMINGQAERERSLEVFSPGKRNNPQGQGQGGGRKKEEEDITLTLTLTLVR